MTAVTDQETVRCSEWARAQELDPVGSAGSYSGFLLIETPLPWPRDPGMVEEVKSIAPLIEGCRLRVQLLVPPGEDVDRRAILYRNDGSAKDVWFSGFRRSETTMADSLAGAVTSLLEAGSTGRGPGQEVLVCTHGKRDVCCGSLGTTLFQKVAPLLSSPDLFIWRTSHTGGHRFAPTFIVLPEGTAWAFADTSLVDAVVHRSAPFADVASRYRGCAGLDGPMVQAVERKVLTTAGWGLLDRARRGYPTGETGADGSVMIRLDARDSRGGLDSWEALVRPGRTLPVPDCMRPLSEAKKSETEWEVEGLRQV
jgi:hypothetical protein